VAQAPPSIRGPAGLRIAATGLGCNWASIWKPLIGAFGPALCEDPAWPFRPCDDRIAASPCHIIDARIAHDVIIDAWWTSL